MQILRMGLVGPGFIAAHHLDAVRRLGDVEIAGVAGSSERSAVARAAELGGCRVFASFEQLLKFPGLDVVHNTTPTHLHREITLQALRAGKHVISDKPLASTAGQCAELRDEAEDAGLVGAVTFNYRGHAMVQQARSMIADGRLGSVVHVQGQYLQDWMTDEHVFSWRVDPRFGVRSSAFADIGTHWCDLAQHVAGARIVSVLADLHTVVKTRYRPTQSAGTFSQSSQDRGEAVATTTEDLGTVLLRFENGISGSMRVGQVLPGHKNDLVLEVSGREGSLRWQQENPNELWHGRHDAPNCVLQSDAPLLDEQARRYAGLPVGHPGGWSDAFRSVIADIYAWIRAGGAPDAKPSTVCSFAEATRIACVLDAVLKSQAGGGVWTAVEEQPGCTNVRR